MKKAQISTMPTVWFLVMVILLLIIFIIAVPPAYRMLILGD